MRKTISLVAFLAAISLTGFGCITIGPSNGQGADGGIFKSADKGSTWAQANTVPTAEGIGNINETNVYDINFDPQDANAIYLSSAGNGLFYSWDGAKSWRYVDSLGGGYVNSVAIDYKDKCTIFAALQNKIFKSSDCTRTWNETYFDTRADVFVSFLAVDPYDSKILYAGLSKGDLLKSVDTGVSWSTIYRFNNKVQKIAIHPTNSNIIFVALQNDGLWRSENKGKTWEDLRENMKDFRDSNEIYDIDMNADGKNIYLTSKYGITKSKDNGNTWQAIKLLTPERSTRIYSFAVNPNDEKELYYSTASTFYSSFDGGSNWVTKKLPTGRVGTALIVHPKDENTLYMGTTQFGK
ncbi:hypothetical protein L6259_01125 [Candidatus Parcubacteria bacterium]|nr:hypothetical protein [Candidatus Parcubacteria bacterium]